MLRGYVISDFFEEHDKELILEAASKAGFELIFLKKWEEGKGIVSDGEFLFCSEPELLGEMPELKWCQSPFAGVDNLLDTGIFDDGRVMLSTSSGAYGLAISEHVIMVTLLLMRQMPTYIKAMDSGEWMGGLSVRSIEGSTVCIAGTGDVGGHTAKAFRALGANTIKGFNRNGHPAEHFDSVHPLDELLSNVRNIDVLVLCLPEEPGTKGILDQELIQALPKKAIVINVGRGSAVDQEALCAALKEGRIAGAALDVMTPEPLPEDHPLRKQNNCILTPHIAGDMCLRHTVEKCRDILCENMIRYAEGRTLVNLIGA